MRDPHTRESRGFGFVNMATAQEADAAKEGLQGENYEGRTLSIEKARRAKPRTSTPGKYFGPPKRGTYRFPLVCIHRLHVLDDFRSRGRFDDRRGGSSYGGRRDDGPYGGRGGGGGGRYEDRGYGGGGGGGRRYDDRGGSDRYSGGSRGPPRESRRDDYGGGGGSYRSGGDAGGSRYEDRAPRGEPREARDSYR
jgi:transformer-2 protein